MNEQQNSDWQALLPWYVNGTLSESEREQLEHEMAKNPELQQEMLWLQQLQNALKQQDAPAPPGELGWMRLRKEIRQDKSANWRRFGIGAATAATILFSVQLGMMMNKPDPAIEVMSGSMSTQALEHHWQLQIAFKADTTAEQIQTLLYEINARIIDGPSAVGLYRVAIPESPQFADQQALKLWLTQQSSVEQVSVVH